MKTIRAILNNEEVCRALANHTLYLRGLGHVQTKATVEIQMSNSPGNITARVEIQIEDDFNQAPEATD